MAQDSRPQSVFRGDDIAFNKASDVREIRGRGDRDNVLECVDACIVCLVVYPFGRVIELHDHVARPVCLTSFFVCYSNAGFHRLDACKVDGQRL